ncbi:MAG: hypothetical protein EA403_08760 [Spirochaetaceae bacterium]|nr:MAG: hypothetical protein EA403_08760 [Spirochaetaceae bacterium]
MKKILILVIALALVGGVAMAQVAVSGEVEARIQRGDDGSHSQTFARVIVSGNVDEYNRIFIRMDQTPGTPPGTTGPGALGVNRAHITTNLGAILGTTDAGVGISWNTGWNEWGYADVAEIDAYNWSGLAVSKPAGTGTKLSFRVMDMVNIHAAVRLLNTDMVADNTAAVIGLDGGVDVGVGNAVFELVFAQTPDAPTAASDNKELGVAAGLLGFEAVEDLTLGLTTAWTFFLDAEGNDPEFGFNVALQAAYGGLVSADFVLVGQDGSEANALGIGIGLTPVDFASLQFGVGIGLDDDVYEDAFDSFDASVLFSLGRATARFGYYWLADDGDGIVPAEFARSNDFSGIYARVKLAF